jgi:hypothetical protein
MLVAVGRRSSAFLRQREVFRGLREKKKGQNSRREGTFYLSQVISWPVFCQAPGEGVEKVVSWHQGSAKVCRLPASMGERAVDILFLITQVRHDLIKSGLAVLSHDK